MGQVTIQASPGDESERKRLNAELSKVRQFKSIEPDMNVLVNTETGSEWVKSDTFWTVQA